jgi:hypothetical protein
MITLPNFAYPSDVAFSLLDFGMIVRPAAGAPALRINRGGSRYVMEFTLPAMQADQARTVKARLTRAKSEGIRVPVPMLAASQGSPGSPVVDTAASAGTTLYLRALTPGYLIKEGYWLTVTDAGGALYLHDVATAVRAGTDGKATVTLGVPLRCALADGAAVLMAKPMIEGLVTSDIGWKLPSEGIVGGLGFTVEEAG